MPNMLKTNCLGMQIRGVNKSDRPQEKQKLRKLKAGLKSET
jgi:hypothetical protein